MKSSRSVWLPACAAASFVSTGIPYWVIPYRQANLPDALLGPGLLVVAAACFLLCLVRVESIWKATAWMGASVVAVVAARVVAETIRDSTSHNLWPLEIIIAMVVGFACAFAGAIAGRLLARILPALRQ